MHIRQLFMAAQPVRLHLLADEAVLRLPSGSRRTGPVEDVLELAVNDGTGVADLHKPSSTGTVANVPPRSCLELSPAVRPAVRLNHSRAAGPCAPARAETETHAKNASTAPGRCRVPLDTGLG